MNAPNLGKPEEVDAAFVAAKSIVSGIAETHRKLIDAVHSIMSTVDKPWFPKAWQKDAQDYGHRVDRGIIAATASGKAVTDILISFETDFYSAFLDPKLSAKDKYTLTTDFQAKCQAIRTKAEMDDQAVKHVIEGLTKVYLSVTNIITTLKQDFQKQITAKNEQIVSDEKEISELRVKLKDASTASKGGCGSAGVGIALSLIPGCEVIGLALLARGAIAQIAADSDAANIARQISAKVEHEKTLRAEIDALGQNADVLTKTLLRVTTGVTTLRKHVEACDQILHYILTQIGMVATELNLVLGMGQEIFEPKYLPFLRANEDLMKQQTDHLSGLFREYWVVLEAHK